MVWSPRSAPPCAPDTRRLEHREGHASLPPRPLSEEGRFTRTLDQSVFPSSGRARTGPHDRRLCGRVSHLRENRSGQGSPRKTAFVTTASPGWAQWAGQAPRQPVAPGGRGAVTGRGSSPGRGSPPREGASPGRSRHQRRGRHRGGVNTTGRRRHRGADYRRGTRAETAAAAPTRVRNPTCRPAQCAGAARANRSGRGEREDAPPPGRGGACAAHIRLLRTPLPPVSLGSRARAGQFASRSLQPSSRAPGHPASPSSGHCLPQTTHVSSLP